MLLLYNEFNLLLEMDNEQFIYVDYAILGFQFLIQNLFCPLQTKDHVFVTSILFNSHKIIFFLLINVLLLQLCCNFFVSLLIHNQLFHFHTHSTNLNFACKSWQLKERKTSYHYPISHQKLLTYPVVFDLYYNQLHQPINHKCLS